MKIRISTILGVLLVLLGVWSLFQRAGSMGVIPILVGLAAYPGVTVTEVELDNENCCLIYSVELGNNLDVKVDAGNGITLYVESDDGDDDDSGGGK